VKWTYGQFAWYEPLLTMMYVWGCWWINGKSMVDDGWLKVELLMEEEKRRKDVGVVGICIGSLLSLSVGDSIVSCYFVCVR
jgi:hypothetical protein